MLRALASALGSTPAQKRRIVLRSDSGFGADANINYALRQGWQVLTKGSGGRRPAAIVGRIPAEAWYELRANDRWVARAVDPPSYARPVQYLALRWRTQTGELRHSTVICSVLEWSLEQVIAQYDARGACESEIGADKGGLKLCQRRKKQQAAQEALVLLTDLAHNLLAWSAHWMFADGPLARFGTTQLIDDVLAIPGRLIFEQDRLVEVQLNVLHPYAAAVAQGLERLVEHFGTP